MGAAGGMGGRGGMGGMPGMGGMGGGSYGGGAPQRGRSRSRSRRLGPGRPTQQGDRLQDEIEAFLGANPVDARAEEALRRAAPEVARNVMQSGIRTARNPSSALSARIRDAEREFAATGGGVGGGCGGGAGGNYVENFLRNAQCDARACDGLRSCPPDVQRIVIENGLVGAKNPSSALMSNIKKAMSGQPLEPRGGRR